MQESSNAGNNEEKQDDDQLGSKARGQLSSSTLVTGSRRNNKVCELKILFQDSNLSKKKSCDTSRELFQSSKRKSARADKSDGNEREDPRESKARKIL